MLTILQTLFFLFGVAFILGFLSRDIQTLVGSPESIAESTATSTATSMTANTAAGTAQPATPAIVPPSETPKT